jgi:hypothetical protein
MANKGTHNWYCIFDVADGYFNQVSTEAESDVVFTLDWSIKNQDVVNGASVLEWAMSVRLKGFENTREYVSNDYWGTNATGIVIGNTGSGSSFTDFILKYGSTTLAKLDNLYLEVLLGETKTIASGTSTIAHEADGTKTSYFSYTLYVDDTLMPNATPTTSGENFGYRASFGTDYITLDSIAKQGVILTAPDFNDEQSPTVTYAIPAESTAAWVGIAIGGSTMTIPYRTVAVTSSSYTFNFTQAEKEAMWAILARGVHTAEARFYIKTTCNGNTLERYEAKTLEIINFMPTLDPEVYDTVPDIVDRLTGNKYILVRYASKPYFNTGAQAHKGATVDVVSAKNGETTKYGTTGTFDSVTDNLFKFAVTDSFGRVTTADMEFSRPNYFVDYVKLTCSISVTEMTADGDVQITLSGKYFNGSFGKRNNSLRLNYDIAKNNEDWEHVDKGYIYPTMNGSDYTYTFTITGLEYLSVYELTLRVSDEIAVEGMEVQTVLASTPIFDWGRQDFNFNVPVTIQGGSVPTIMAQGTSGIWTYRTWSDGTAECWGKKDVSVTFPSSANWGGLYTTGAISGSNISFPFGLFAETPVVNASLLIRSAGGILMAPGGAGSNIANWDQTGVYEIARGAYVSGTQYYTINYQVIGRWK